MVIIPIVLLMVRIQIRPLNQIIEKLKADAQTERPKVEYLSQLIAERFNHWHLWHITLYLAPRKEMFPKSVTDLRGRLSSRGELHFISIGMRRRNGSVRRFQTN